MILSRTAPATVALIRSQRQNTAKCARSKIRIPASGYCGDKSDLAPFIEKPAGEKEKSLESEDSRLFGAARQIRTADLILTKDALYLLSYSSISVPFGTMQTVLTVVFKMATRKGLEPSTSGVTGRRSNQLNYRAIYIKAERSVINFGRGRRNRTLGTRFWRPLLYLLSYTPIWWAFTGSNRGPTGYEPAALTN